MIKKRKIFVNPGHGNEPYILGSLVADGVASRLRAQDEDVSIIVPLIYGERQRQILGRYNLANVIFDETLGNFYQKILFRDNNFSQYLDDIIQNKDDAESEVRAHLAEEYWDISLEINAGSRITSSATAYYTFPVLFSELLSRTASEDALSFFDKPKLERCYNLIKKSEGGYHSIFIPSHHTFSFDPWRKPNKNEVQTPPLKPTLTISDVDIPPNSVYCMVSGTGSERDTMLLRASGLQEAGYNVIIPPWTGAEGFRMENPDVIAHPNITKVLARAGWGTIWTCQQAGKKFEALPYTPSDDPEIYFNLKTLHTIPLTKATTMQRTQFRNMDGIAYVAEKINQDFLESQES